jgi:hypothetical protein
MLSRIHQPGLIEYVNCMECMVIRIREGWDTICKVVQVLEHTNRERYENGGIAALFYSHLHPFVPLMKRNKLKLCLLLFQNFWVRER